MIMVAFDTNLLVRIAVNDDLKQAEIAEQLLDSNEVFVSRTVLLETEWVLRSVYKKSCTDIAQYFENALMTKNFIMENSIEVSHALEWYKLGADFADAMHLCMCGESVLHTFDAEFCKAAHNLRITPAFRIL
jgi:predicted nucleic-acid-binding protein